MSQTIEQETTTQAMQKLFDLLDAWKNLSLQTLNNEEQTEMHKFFKRIFEDLLDHNDFDKNPTQCSILFKLRDYDENKTNIIQKTIDEFIKMIKNKKLVIQKIMIDEIQLVTLQFLRKLLRMKRNYNSQYEEQINILYKRIEIFKKRQERNRENALKIKIAMNKMIGKVKQLFKDSDTESDDENEAPFIEVTEEDEEPFANNRDD